MTPYKSLEDCVLDLEKQGELLRIEEEVDPHLEMAEIHRKTCAAKGPAILFCRVKGSPFRAVSNLFGTLERSRWILRRSLGVTKNLIALKAEPQHMLRRPWQTLSVLTSLPHALPRRTWRAPVLQHETTLDQLPQLQCWPKDGGAFLTLPQVYSESPLQPGWWKSNLGMYRIQISGGSYAKNKEVGLHYQIHRGIGIHHGEALAKKEPLKVAIFLGGPPAHTVAAVMPLPEGLPEISLAGVLAGRAWRYSKKDGYHIAADADFCIIGTVDLQRTLPEGPFGDHLGYYSLTHPFPVLKVEKVFHRPNAIFPFTVVGRPPQEDTSFGALIHEMTAPMVPKSIPGVRTLHAVDEAGVHPLLLAVGSERYVPYEKRRPQEILTQANAILGFGQASLAKYLWMAAQEDAPDLDPSNVPQFFSHILERVRWEEDLHFQTRTTIDTLDYSGTGLNEGSKLVIAAAGGKKRDLLTSLPQTVLPRDWKKIQMIAPGIAAAEGPKFLSYEEEDKRWQTWEEELSLPEGLPLFVLVDDADFVAKDFANFLWVTFTRSNPSHDIHGVKSFTAHKHWGCRGALIIDARSKPHHAPALE